MALTATQKRRNRSRHFCNVPRQARDDEMFLALDLTGLPAKDVRRMDKVELKNVEKRTIEAKNWLAFAKEFT